MKTISTHAACAKAIRKELKEAFPNVKFKVVSDSFAGGDSVDIQWMNGPIEDKVTNITCKYQYGHFDGMNDIYENDNRRYDVPQVKYVQTNREISDEIMQDCFNKMKLIHNGWEHLNSIDQSCQDFFNQWRCWTARYYIWGKLNKLDLTNTENLIERMN